MTRPVINVIKFLVIEDFLHPYAVWIDLVVNDRA